MIIVTGANGQLGRSVVERLLLRVPASDVGVSVRDVSKAAHFEALGVRVRHGDFEKPDSLAHAFEGAGQVLVVSSNARATGGDTLEQHRAAIDAARTAGATRVVYTSHMAASDASEFPPMRDHSATERLLQESGVAWTALRNGFYASSGIAMMGDVFETGRLDAPVDGPVSWTAHADLAEAAAIVLTNDGLYDGPTPALTGVEAIDFTGLAALVATVNDTPVRREIITDDALRARVAARGAPERAATTVLGFFIAARNGEFATVDPTLEQLLGRRPVLMRDVIADHVSARDLSTSS